MEKDGPPIDLVVPVSREDAISELWYHGDLTEKKSEAILTSKGRKGSYLIFYSQERKGFVLSVRLTEGVFHANINEIGAKFAVEMHAQRFDSLQDLIDYCIQNPLVSNGKDMIHLSVSFKNTSFHMTNINMRIKELEKESFDMFSKTKFWDEFEELQKQEISILYSRDEGLKLANNHKNCYKNIVPFDHTMVTLKECDPYGSSYINASYISIDSSKPAYIATQGCLNTTVDDFWSMVWEENCCIIVLLTELVEKGRVKCQQYWPDTVQPQHYGKYYITTVEETTTTHFTFRHLLVMKDESEYVFQERHIFQYHLRVWPDYTIPQSPAILLDFIDEVNKKSLELNVPERGPLLVQCSEGIGRSGTYIAVDILLKEIEREGWDKRIDIHHCVRLLRTQRKGMVQTDSQYKFIYETLLCFLLRNQASIIKNTACNLRKQHMT
jgi:tyrosine-protein phosphatase non-receptor type 11